MEAALFFPKYIRYQTSFLMLYLNKSVPIFLGDGDVTIINDTKVKLDFDVQGRVKVDETVRMVNTNDPMHKHRPKAW